jgi:hypothetical protein
MGADDGYVYFFMISTVMCLFGVVLAGVNRYWRWVLGFVAGIIVNLSAFLIYGL